jgi:hypothetical protein
MAFRINSKEKEECDSENDGTGDRGGVQRIQRILIRLIRA